MIQPVSPIPPRVAQKTSDFLRARAHGLARGGQQSKVDQEVGEGAVEVVVLAVDVGGDGAADRDVLGPGVTGGMQPRGSRTSITSSIDAGLAFQDAGSGSKPRRRLAVLQDDHPARVQGGVAVAAAQAARDQ